jgi:hypothetical protein
MMDLRNAVDLYRLRGLTPSNVAGKSREQLVKYMQNESVLEACKEFYTCMLAKINERHGCTLQDPSLLPFAFLIKEAPFQPADKALHEQTLSVAAALSGKVQEIFSCLEVGLLQNKEVSFDLVHPSITADFEQLFNNFGRLHHVWHDGFNDSFLKVMGDALCSQYVLRDAVDDELLNAAIACDMQDIMAQSFRLVDNKIMQLQGLIQMRLSVEHLAQIQMQYDLNQDTYKVC